MTTPGDFHDPDLTGNLIDEKAKLAYAEGHDADIPTNLGKYDPGAKEKDIGVDPTPTESNEPATTDPNIVWWNEPADQDPENPMNWSTRRKWISIASLSFMTLVIPLASSMFAPGVPLVLKEFHVDSTLLSTFVVSVYILGFAVGPLVVAPLSELYGRMPLYTISNILFVVFCVACAVSTNMGMLIAFRFLMGCVGVTPLTIGSGTIADMMPQEQRGSAMAIWALGPLLGPVIGPVGGGYLVEAKGWRWIYWLLAIISGFGAILGIVVLRETYAPVILARKAARLRKETGNLALRSKLDTGLAPNDLFLRAIVRPTKMLFTSPIVFILCTYVSICYGILYLLFTTYTFVFEGVYHFTSGQVGLTFLGTGIGMIFGLGIFGSSIDRLVKRQKALGLEMKPEHRLPLWLTLPSALSIPIGLFMYGWTAQYHVFWLVPLIGTLFVGFGILGIFMCVQTYLVDAFTIHAASATAANTVLRSLFGAVLPLCALQMYHKLGLGWGNSLLAFLALSMVPIPFILEKYGERIRTNPRFQPNL